MAKRRNNSSRTKLYFCPMCLLYFRKTSRKCPRGRKKIGLRRSLPIELEAHKWIPEESLLAQRYRSPLLGKIRGIFSSSKKGTEPTFANGYFCALFTGPGVRVFTGIKRDNPRGEFRQKVLRLRAGCPNEIVSVRWKSSVHSLQKMVERIIHTFTN